jgi:hypothetical protein
VLQREQQQQQQQQAAQAAAAFKSLLATASEQVSPALAAQLKDPSRSGAGHGVPENHRSSSGSQWEAI